MESWILHYNANYDAVAWPFAISWEEYLAAPQPLIHPCTDFARVPPCDGTSEMPHVPPHLPRLKARGQYTMAVYHDSEWLYVLLESRNGPDVISGAALDRIPHFASVDRVYPVLALLTPDQQFVYRFGLAGGKPIASVSPQPYGARRPTPPELVFDWDGGVIPSTQGDLAHWRVRRRDVESAFLGNTVGFSVSRIHFESHEAVAWGSHTTWGSRPDEDGTVRLVTQRSTP